MKNQHEGLDLLRVFAEYAPDDILFGELTPLTRHNMRTVHPDLDTLIEQRKEYIGKNRPETPPPTSGQLFRRRRRLNTARHALDVNAEFRAMLDDISRAHTAVVNALVALRGGVDLDEDVLTAAWPESERKVIRGVYTRDVFHWGVRTTVHGIGGVYCMIASYVDGDVIENYAIIAPWPLVDICVDDALDGTVELALVISEIFGAKQHVVCDYKPWKWDFDIFMHVFE